MRLCVTLYKGQKKIGWMKIIIITIMFVYNHKKWCKKTQYLSAIRLHTVDTQDIKGICNEHLLTFLLATFFTHTCCKCWLELSGFKKSANIYMHDNGTSTSFSVYTYFFLFHSALFDFYHYFYMVTNVLFYVSSAINPILYNLVSANYRHIFFATLRYLILPCRHNKQKRILTRHSISICSNQTFSTNVIKETIY